MGAQAFARARAPKLIHRPEDNPTLVARAAAEMARISPQGYGQAVHMLASGDLAASVARGRVSPGFILGAEDQVTPARQTQAAAEAWAAAHGRAPPVVTLAGAGHAAYLQAPKAFTAALISLVPELAAAAAQKGAAHV